MFRYISQRGQVIRSYFSGIGKTGVIYPAAFLAAMALGQVNLGLIFYVKEVFKATSNSIGWLVGTWWLSYVFGCLVMRPAFNRVLPRYLIIASNICAFVLIVGMLYSPALSWLFVLNSAYGMAMSLFWNATFSSIASQSYTCSVMSRLLSL